MKMYKIVKNIRNQVVRNQKSMYQLAKAAPKTSEGPEGTRRDQDRGISRDQKGPERTRKDQKGPGGASSLPGALKHLLRYET